LEGDQLPERIRKVAEGRDQPVGFGLIEHFATRLCCSASVGVEGGTPFDVVNLGWMVREVAGYDSALVSGGRREDQRATLLRNDRGFLV